MMTYYNSIQSNNACGILGTPTTNHHHLPHHHHHHHRPHVRNEVRSLCQFGSLRLIDSHLVQVMQSSLISEESLTHTPCPPPPPPQQSPIPARTSQPGNLEKGVPNLFDARLCGPHCRPQSVGPQPWIGLHTHYTYALAPASPPNACTAGAPPPWRSVRLRFRAGYTYSG